MREVKKSFWDLVVVNASSIVVMPLMIVSEMLQTRHLGTDGYGKVGLVYSAVMFLFLFAVNWLSMSIMRFGKEEFIKQGSISKTTTSYFILAVASLVTFIFPFYFFRVPLFEFLEVNHPHAFFIIVVGVCIQIFRTYVLQALRTVHLIKIAALLERVALKSIFLAIILMPIVFTTDWLNVDYVIAGLLLSDFAITIIGLFFLKREYIFPLKFDRKQLNLVFLFAYPLFFASWSNFVINYVDMYTIKYYMTMEDVGVYNAAYKIFNATSNVACTGFTSVLVPMLIALKSEGRVGDIKHFVSRFTPQLTMFMFLMVSVLIVLAEPLFSLLYPEDFQGAVDPFMVLSASIVATSMGVIINGLCVAFDMTKLITTLSILWGVLNLVGDIVLVRYLGVMGPSWVSLMVFTLSPLTLAFIMYRKLGIHRYLPLLFITLILLVLFVNLLNISYFWRVVSTVAIMVFAVLFSRRFNLFNHEDQNMMKNINMPAGFRRQINRMIELISR